ncbi:MAG: class I SAM-dependent methyltransferase [Bacteroidota bacterium]
MINPLKSLFQKEIPAKSNIPFTAEQLAGDIRTNRSSLRLIDNWINEEAFARSYFQYGVPGFLKPLINKPIDDSPTYTDLMTFIAKKYFEQVNYLEIGVSVGKNFFQMMHSLQQAQLTGFDIEEINPIIEKELKVRDKKEWPTPAGSIKKNASSLTTYTFGDKKVNYLSADVWDANSWAKLEGNKYNIVFSDALHTPKAILFEFEMLFKYQLLDEKFIIVWDDLVGKMRNSFFKIIRKYNEVYNIKDIYLLEVNGWVGQHESPHSVGIISNLLF